VPYVDRAGLRASGTRRQEVGGVTPEELAIEGTIYEPGAGLPEIRFTTLEDFAAVDEPGAAPLASSTDGGVVIPSAGIVLVYGSGGAGKTTLVLDLSFALAAGDSWLELIEPEKPLRVALIENEGPRPEFRRKLRAKLETTERDLNGRICVLEEPWATLTLANEQHRRAIALAIVETEADMLVLGPLVSAGEFPTGGTPDEIRRFEQHVAELRELVETPFAIVLVHHENRAGQVSGAWERLPDTLMHITPQGHGRTRLFWQKARWASSLHGTSTHLVWAEGETFTVDAKPEITEDGMRDALLNAVRANPGGSWSKIRDSRDDQGGKLVRGNLTKLEALRDRLLTEGHLVNGATREGHFKLWLTDDPAARRSDAGTGLERLTFHPPASEDDPIRSTVPLYRGNGSGNGTDQSEPEPLDTPPSEDGLEWR
jgi:hypothetical protein